MANPVPRVRVPASAKKGEIVEVKTLISHDMESGQRKDSAGATIPRKIIKRFEARYNGKNVFEADWNTSVSTNPYQSFFFRAQESGTLDCAWTDDDGSVYKSTSKINVA
ncbi:thiosulfate oxidation carrier complex protein SoxZ [Paeniroseomonas aquatica]|uniref:Thiosulfate oxidation carrier complex protein SoxZ n=1 Tax=Paeniroseomonas aquatica TaxID=373043 RepID=A0ABT8A3D6_9PROT|nr:thiosulfate oxidation carrier complex protein SoxZ [Paeniroseomonas aquatica]MDN3564161.1 thiosulfate oxidation carrier complex protein SoxZ [Paeniroseomonas aquatica]